MPGAAYLRLPVFERYVRMLNSLPFPLYPFDAYAG